MKKLRLLSVALVLLLITAFQTHSMELDNIVVFGDSLSDNGNFLASHGTNPPPPYYEGRFSDGPVWFEYLAQKLGVPGLALNYAVGGAKTGSANTGDDLENSISYPGFADQVDTYLSVVEALETYPGAFANPAKTLFFIWIGANDFWTPTDPETQITEAISNIMDGIQKLIGNGATKFIVITLPDLGKTPKFNWDPALSAQATQLSAGFNQALANVLTGMQTVYYYTTIELFDVTAVLADFTANAEAYGFVNTTNVKLDISEGTIAEGKYLFWDDVHPTTYTHKLFAAIMADTINCENCQGSLLPSFEEDFAITVPSIELGHDSYGFRLVPYANPAEEGFFWMLDLESIDELK